MLWCFSYINEHQLFGMIVGNLAQYLATDGTSRACEQDFFACEHLAHLLHIHLDGVSGQKVLDTDFLELRTVEIAILRPFLGFGGHIDFHARLDEHILQFLVVSERLILQRRHQHRPDIAVLDYFGQFITHVIHLHAHENFS